MSEEQMDTTAEELATTMDSDVDRSTADTAVSRPPLLDDATCLVTGASRGIGRAIALDLARHGGDVVVNYHSSPKEATVVTESIKTMDTTALSVQADVSDIDSVEAMTEEVHDTVGPIDVLVNNAGINIDKKFPDLSTGDWQRVIEVNLGGAFNVTQAFFDDVAEAENGRIINISSVNAERGSYGQTNYAAS
ncbi:MAG: SDR family NAD(P)-dependent oxidoreductase, partial [Halodesulfurarchaeum sp.]